jgi:membrane protease YdiL (CAAX protease family)
MDLRSIFINEYGRLRSGFRLVIFVAAYLFIWIALTATIGLAYALLHDRLSRLPHEEFFQNMTYRVPLLVAALGAGYLCTRFLEGLPWRAVGLTLHDKWLQHFIVGSVIGIASLLLAAGIASAGGGLAFAVNNVTSPAHVVRSVLASGFLFVFAALAEEATFRGYPVQTLTRAHWTWLGVFLTSVPFALAHLSNPNVVPGVTFANTALAGIWLAVAYLRTRSLWFPLGVHWAWNWAMGSLFGLPVSGLQLVGAPLLKAKDLGPAWLTGGSYGLEGGIASTIALIASTLVIWRTGFVEATPEMLRLTSEEKRLGS